jgi:hypothetical protein
VTGPVFVTALTVLASVLVLSGNLPVLLGIRRGEVRPVPVTWAGWTALMLVGGWAVLTARHDPAAVFILAEAVGCAAIAVCALRIPAGDRDKPESVCGVRLDLACLPGIVAGLLLLLAVRSPALAVSVTVGTDLLIFVPTYAHIWAHPWRESVLGYAAFSVGSAVMLLVSDWSTPVGWAYPVYLFVGDGVAAVLAVARRHRMPVTPTVVPAVVPVTVSGFPVAPGDG